MLWFSDFTSQPCEFSKEVPEPVNLQSKVQIQDRYPYDLSLLQGQHTMVAASLEPQMTSHEALSPLKPPLAPHSATLTTKPLPLDLCVIPKQFSGSLKPNFSSVGLRIQRCSKHKSLPSSCLCYQVAHSKSLTEKEVGLEFMQQMLSVNSFLGRCFLTHWTQSKCDLLLHPQGLCHVNCGSQCACYVSDLQTSLPFQGLCPMSPFCTCWGPLCRPAVLCAAVSQSAALGAQAGVPGASLWVCQNVRA